MATSHRTPPVPAPGDHITTHPDDPVYTMVGEWVALAPISDRAARLYWLLRAHVNHNRTNPDGTPNEQAWPTQQRLAAMLRVSKRQTIGAALKELVDIGAVVVEEVRYAGGMRRRNKYLVRLAPPPGYDGWRSANDFELPDDTGSTSANVEVIGADAEKPQVSRTSATADLRRSAPADINHTNKNHTNKTSPPRAGARRRKSARARNEPTQPRAADHPPTDDWVSDDPEETIQNILDHVEQRYAVPPGVERMLLSKITDDGIADPQHLMHLALKASRWGTVDFRAIRRLEASGYAPDPIRRDVPAAVALAPAGVRS